MPDSAKRHTISYEILNMRPDEPPREIEVHATREEINRLADEGYMIRERMFTGESLELLREGMDRLEAKEMKRSQYNGDGKSSVRKYGGFYFRYLMDKDQAFLDLLKHQPLLSIARALMGPMITMNAGARITYPGPENQETEWHQHRRYIPKPLPPWFMRPHALDVLIYLDDVNEANGPLCVLPGSHHRIQEEPAPEFYGDFPDQVKLCPSAGTAVLLHTNLWHRAMQTTPEGTKRRLLIVSYAPTWLKKGMLGVQPENGLTVSLLENANEETLELLGKKGYM